MAWQESPGLQDRRRDSQRSRPTARDGAGALQYRRMAAATYALADAAEDPEMIDGYLRLAWRWVCLADRGSQGAAPAN